MKQMTLAAGTGFEKHARARRKAEFLALMDFQRRGSIERLREFADRGEQGRRGGARRQGREIRQERHTGQVSAAALRLELGDMAWRGLKQ